MHSLVNTNSNNNNNPICNVPGACFSANAENSSATSNRAQIIFAQDILFAFFIKKTGDELTSLYNITLHSKDAVRSSKPFDN